MIEVPKLVLILVIGFLVWYVTRRINRGPTRSMPPRPWQRRQPPRSSQIEDLVACRKCGAYVALNAPACGRAGCPQPH